MIKNKFVLVVEFDIDEEQNPKANVIDQAVACVGDMARSLSKIDGISHCHNTITVGELARKIAGMTLFHTHIDQVVPQSKSDI